MAATLQKSDFVLAPYMKSNDLRATYQLLNTIVPYIALWVLAYKAASVSVLLLPPIILLMTLFAGRCFSLMHDCGHYSLFTSKRINRVVGFGLGVINAIPQYPWSRGHAYHHKTNGDWERYRGPSALLSTEEFLKLSPFKQTVYGFLRNPAMIFPGGFFYLAIKPRLALILGLYGFVIHAFQCLTQKPGIGLRQIILSYQSKTWYTTGEFWDLLLNNTFVVGLWIYLSHLLGAGLFFSTYFISLTLAGAIFICVFFVQHNFEESYAHKTEGWDYLRGAIEGTSYLKLHPILNWFTADIGYHNIHHLSERIPNYNLRACHNENIHLLKDVKELRISDIPKCFKFILWDANSNSLQSIEALHAQQTGNVSSSAISSQKGI